MPLAAYRAWSRDYLYNPLSAQACSTSRSCLGPLPMLAIEHNGTLVIGLRSGGTARDATAESMLR